MKLRTYSMAELEANPDHGPVWVKNSSRDERRGDVVLTIARNSGIGSDTLVVPATFIPLDLTTIVSRPQLLRDNQFRQALAVGLLVLVHPEDAQKLFEEDEDAKEELQRLSNYMLVGPVVHQQQAVQNGVEVFSDLPDESDGMPAPVSDMIKRLQRAHNANDLDEKMESEAAARLRSMGELSEDVLKHVHHCLKKIAPKVARTARKMAEDL